MSNAARLFAAILGAGAIVPAPSFICPDPPRAPALAPAEPEPEPAPLPQPAASAPPTLPAPLATLVNVHTAESVALTDDEPSAERFAELLEDRVTGERQTFDPRLLNLLRALARKHAAVRIELVSGYRSAKLNEMLRKKEHHVASHSQHSLGHAVDFRLGDMAPKDVRKEIEALGWSGGIGQYDGKTDRFVHADVGPDRRWRER